MPVLALAGLLCIPSLASATPSSVAPTATPGSAPADLMDDAFGLASVQLSTSPATGATPVSGTTPVLDPPAAMSVRAGRSADQALHASDADGDPVTFAKISSPPYMTVTTVDPGAGVALGNVHLAPTPADIGATTAGVSASDGSLTARQWFGVVVFAILNQPTDMVVEEGATADQVLSVTDPERDTYTFSLASGPSFVTVMTTSDTTGIVHLAPAFTDAGSYRATVAVAVGSLVDERSFQITVANVNRPPVLVQPPDMHAVPGIATDRPLVASDPDGQTLVFLKIAGPSFMYVGPGYVRLLPSNADVGGSTATVAVSDGSLSDEKSFAIQVDFVDADPVLAVPEDMTLDEGTDQDQVVSAFDPDGQPLSFDAWYRPRFMLVSKLSQDLGGTTALGRVRLMPSYDDSGAYTPTLVVSDGRYRDSKPFNINVRDAYPGETSLRLGIRSDGEVSHLVETEYSRVDGAFTADLFPGGNFLVFRFRETSSHGASWTVEFKASPGFALSEGQYDNARISTDGAGPAISVVGLDPDLPGDATCSPVTARLTIQRLIRRLDGSLLSFWATFQEFCPDTTLFLQGEVRYQVASVPITLVAPRWYPTNADETFWFEIAAVDTARDAIALSATGVPPGAKFIDLGRGEGRLGWTPTRDLQGDHTIQFTAVSAGGLADTALTTIRVAIANHAPAVRANGPYEGTVGVPLPFSSAGTTDLDGDSLSYLWNFGDGTTAEGPAPTHSYGATGPYPVSLLVSDGNLSAGDPTLARILAPRLGRAIQAGAGGPIRLEAGSARFCATMELGIGLTGRDDVAGMQMRVEGLGSVNAIVADSESVVVGDSNRNGMSEVTACFNRGDLRRLLADVTGRVSADATIDVSLRDGHGWNAPLRIDVIGPGSTLSVLTAPNPLNPKGTLSFVTRRSGFARLRLFDVRGRLVRTLLESALLEPGFHDVVIDGCGGNGVQLSSGVYLYRLETAEGTRTGRIALVK